MIGNRIMLRITLESYQVILSTNVLDNSIALKFKDSDRGLRDFSKHSKYIFHINNYQICIVNFSTNLTATQETCCISNNSI